MENHAAMTIREDKRVYSICVYFFIKYLDMLIVLVYVIYIVCA